MSGIEVDRTALLLIDLQNDFVHPQGAYSRGGVAAASISVLPARLVPVVEAARSSSVPVVSTLFTLVPGPDGPLISDHLRDLRPFLASGDFAPGSWGQQLLEELAPADVTVEKVAYSAFHASRLAFVLDRLAVTSLLVAGIVTNGGVESTVRAAHVLDIDTIVIADGCAAFTDDAHEAALASMATVGEVTSCAAVIDALQAARVRS
ncbi:MAG: cysteine hydrolase family protein [Acidimicrobiales bacterium]